MGDAARWWFSVNWVTRRNRFIPDKGRSRKGAPSESAKSRVTGDCQARFCEGLEVKFLRATRPRNQSTMADHTHLATGIDEIRGMRSPVLNIFTVASRGGERRACGVCGRNGGDGLG